LRIKDNVSMNILRSLLRTPQDRATWEEVVRRSSLILQPPDFELSAEALAQRRAEREAWLAADPLRRLLFEALEGAFQMYRQRRDLPDKL
jgi:hypothetical protein